MIFYSSNFPQNNLCVWSDNKYLDTLVSTLGWWGPWFPIFVHLSCSCWHAAMLPCPIPHITCHHQPPCYPQPRHEACALFRQMDILQKFCCRQQWTCVPVSGPGRRDGNTNELCKNAPPTIAQVCAAVTLAAHNRERDAGQHNIQDKMIE